MISIDDILALSSKEFLEYIEPLKYQGLKNLKVLLEIEEERSKLLYEKYKAEENLVRMRDIQVNATIIKERIGTCSYFLLKKGIDLSIFTK